LFSLGSQFNSERWCRWTGWCNPGVVAQW